MTSVAFWRRYDEMEARLTRPVSERMLDIAGVAAGMRVLDVASGRGEPALPAAHRVGPRGSVLAVDLDDGMLQIGRERAKREGLENVEFRVADAEALDAGDQAFDAATVRWGLMYMRRPERALASIRGALTPGGALAVASWAEPSRVPFASLPRRILEGFRDVPPRPPEAPGVFRDADPAALDGALRRAGLLPEAWEEIEVPVVEAADGRGIVAWIADMGGPLMQLVEELPRERRKAWEEALCRAAEKHHTGGMVALGGVTRITLARRRE